MNNYKRTTVQGGETMEINELKKLQNELEILLQIEKELVNETRKIQSDNLDLKVDLTKIHKKIDRVTCKLDFIMNQSDIQFEKGKLKKKFTSYSDEEIYNMRQKWTLKKTAKYLNCSISTIQRICNRYLEQKNNNLFDDDLIEL